MRHFYSRTLLSLVALASTMGLLLFIPAGTIRFWRAWVYLTVFMAASCLISLYLIYKDPALLSRRMRGGPTAEKEPKQKLIMLFASTGFVAVLLVPALDFRFSWSSMPVVLVVVGNMLVAIGFYFVFLVYKENTYSSATIEIAEGQRVITSGPYSFVRHPMYAGASLYVLGTPLALGSYFGLLAFVFMFAFIIWRLIEEERFLAERLPGYIEYQNKVRYRLVPYMW